MADGRRLLRHPYYAAPQEYGAWFARLHSDSQPSNVCLYDIFLLWPDNSQWPPEIDITEAGAGRAPAPPSTIRSELCSSPTPHACMRRATAKWRWPNDDSSGTLTAWNACLRVNLVYRW